MLWTSVREFPLERDLTELVQLLRARQIPHRVTEYQGRQILQVPDPRLSEPVGEFIDTWLAGGVPAQDTPVVEQTEGEPGAAVLLQLRKFPLTVLLIALSLLGFAAARFAPLQAWLGELTFVPLLQVPGGYYLGELNDTLASGQWWRLISPAFLHFSIFHIVFNALWTWELGRRLEWVMGPWRYAVFFLFSALASNLTQYVWPSQAAMFGGMSGVVYAMVGFISIHQWLRPHPALAVPRGILIFMLAWLGICMLGVVDLFMSGGVANGAHLGGLVAGAALGGLSAIRQPKTKQ